MNTFFNIFISNPSHNEQRLSSDSDTLKKNKKLSVNNHVNTPVNKTTPVNKNVNTHVNKNVDTPDDKKSPLKKVSDDSKVRITNDSKKNEVRLTCDFGGLEKNDSFSSRLQNEFNLDSTKIKFKRFKFKSKKIFKYNFVTHNNDLKSNLNALIKILLKLNEKEDVDKYYFNTINFTINPKDKKEYKEIFLEYPDLYFYKYSFKDEFIIQDEFTSQKQIYIIDYKYIKNDVEFQKKMIENKNYQYIVLINDNDNFTEKTIILKTIILNKEM